MVQEQISVGVRRRLQAVFVSGAPSGVGTWSVSPVGPTLSNLVTTLVGTNSTVEVRFISTNTGIYTVKGLVPLTDGQILDAVFVMQVV